MFVHNDDVKSTVMMEGVTRKVRARGGSLMMVEVTFDKKGTILPKHKHFHEQVTYIVKGSMEFEVNGETQIIKPGDSVYMPSNMEHGAVILEDDTVALDTFTPQREDFLE